MAHAASFEAQQAAKLSAEELQELTKELFNWSKDATKKAGRKGLAAEAAPPAAATAAGQSAGSGAVQQEQQAGPASTARHPAAHTYEHYRSKWDKFDVDAALSEDGEEQGGSAAVNSTRPASAGGSGGPRSSASAPMAIPQARVTVPVGPSPPAAADGGAAPASAEGWKDAGNEHFKRGRYRQAVEAYTASLALQPTCLAAANRAMARLKLGQHEEAEADCGEALRLDPLYVKAYQRRATARRQLGDLLGAVQDHESVLRLEPSNKQAAADRAECVRQVLRDGGLQAPSRSERLAVRVAPAPSGAAVASEAAGAEAGAVGGGAEELLMVSSVQRQPRVQAGDGAAGMGAAGQGEQTPLLSGQHLSPATPTASIQVLEAVDGDDSMPDLVEQQAPPPQQQQQQQQEQQAGAEAAGEQAKEVASPHRQQPAELPAERQDVCSSADMAAPMDQDQQPAAAPATAHMAVMAPAGSAAAAQPAAAPCPAPARPAVAAAAPTPLRVPRTGVDFEKAWKAFKGDAQRQAAYLLALQPAQLPPLLKQALTPGLLAAAAGALLRPALQQQPGQAVALLEGLPGVARFDINLLSVPPRQKAELAAAWDAAQPELAGTDGALAGRLEGIRRKYKL